MKKSKPTKALGFVFRQARDYKFFIFLVIFIMLIYVGLDFVYPFAYKHIINSITQDEINSALIFSGLLSTILIYALSMLGHRIFRDIASFFLIRIEINTMRKTLNQAMAHVAKLSYKFYISTFAGSTARKINRGVGRMEDMFDVFLLDLTPTALVMITAVIILIKTNIIIGLILGISLVIFIVITLMLVKKRMQLDEVRNIRENKLSGVLIDSLTNNLTVKTFTGEPQEEKLFQNKSFSWAKATIKAWQFDTWIRVFQGSFIGFLEVGILFLALWFWRNGELAVGDIVFIHGNMNLLMFPMWTLGRFWRNFKRAEVDMQDLIKLMQKPIIIKSRTNAPALQIKSGQINFSKINFSYEKKTRNVLRNINIIIRPGEKVALVGPSGAGKSTFSKLLFRFVDPTRGKILIDNQDIKQVNLKTLRQSISLVPQEPLLFHRSIYENIKYGQPKADKLSIIKAAKLAHAHEFIKNLPRKYNSLVGERGIKLSGGERQRIALARVFLENAPILILDEATSSLDSISENLIQKALDNLMENRTTIVIAHRLSTIRKMDRILVFERGRIAESGTHKQLIKTSKIYKKLWQSQAGKFLG
ncbi:hypothetical protein CL633_02715 [bacterium]|nr:hypothetical protein [bacterium]|tara:strand:- start:741 stop:2507 length:1767 start_codon:yes stop_codon:yes gene_type:complete